MSFSAHEAPPSATPVRHHLAVLRIASPCHERFQDMTGDDQRRFCARCEKHVHNLSAMSADEAEALLSRAQGGLCVRFYRRADGTVITGDCPVGVRRQRKSLLFAAVATVLGGLSSALSLVGCADKQGACALVHKAQVKAESKAYDDVVTTEAGTEPAHALTGDISPAPPMMMGEPAPPPAIETGRLAKPR